MNSTTELERYHSDTHTVFRIYEYESIEMEYNILDIVMEIPHGIAGYYWIKQVKLIFRNIEYLY